MSLSIELDSESDKPRIFSQGELVSGKVVFNCRTSEDVTSIIISLKGEVRTRVTGGDVYSAQAYVCDTTLCEFNQTLFKGPYTLPAGRHEYVFQFTFPDYITEPINHHFGQDDRFTSHIDDKTLPPSFEMEDKSMSIYSNGIVVYELHAKIPRKLRDLKTTHHLIFYPYRLEENPDYIPKTLYKPINHHVHVAEDGVSLRELTTGEAFKEKLRHSPKTITVTFNVSVTAPTAIILNESFPLKLAIHLDPSSSDSDNLKPVIPLTLKEYHVSLQDKSTVRAAFMRLGRSNDEVGFFGETLEVSKGTDSVPLTLDEEVTLDVITLDPARFAPTFKSFQITGNWSLHVKVTVICAEKEFTVFLLLEGVRLLSPKVHPKVLGLVHDYPSKVLASS